MSNEEILNEEEAENTASEETLDKAEQVGAEAESPAAQPEADETANAVEAEKPDQPKAATPAKKNGAGMSKMFKLIYYPVVAIFVVLMLVFSIIDGAFGYSPDVYGGDYYTAVNAHIAELSRHPRSAMSATTIGSVPAGLPVAREYIKDTLVAGGFKFVEEDKPDAEDDEKQVTVTDWYVSQADTTEPTVTLHTAVPSVDLQNDMGVSGILAGYELTNIIAAIPSGKADADAVVITVRYDSRSDTVGAGDNAAFVANVMQSLIEYIKSDAKPTNDIIVVFVEELDNAFGTYAFFDSFQGLGNAASRAKAGINLDAYGNGGTLALTDISGASLDYINAVTSVTGSAFNSSVVQATIPDALARFDEVKAFGDVPAVQVAVLGGLDAAQSSLDNAENVSQAVLRQQSELIKNYLNKFGGAKCDFGTDDSDKTTVFSYFDAGTVAYNDVAAYVIGALLLVLIGVTVAMLIVKKTFSLKKLLWAALAQLLVVVGTLVATVAAYFLVTLMLTGFGVLPINAIISISYFNAGILIAAMLVSLASAFGFSIFFKKMFKITSSDAVRGTAVLFALAGVVMSFACPAYAFMTVWLGISMTAILLITVCVHKSFKAKFGFGMDKLYLYVIPVALCLPLVMAQLPMLMQLLPLAMLPLYMTVFTAMLGVAVPYLERTRPLLDKVAKKLPMRTQRVERVVTERVEDRAKKGKFTERTVKRIEKEKVAVNYKNYFGVSMIAVIAIVVALFSGGFGVTMDKTLAGYYSYENAAYNDALVLEVGDNSQRIVIDDLMLYKYARYAIDGLEWNGSAYTKTPDRSVNYKKPEITTGVKDITTGVKKYTVVPYEGSESVVTLTIPSAKSITKITVKEGKKAMNEDYEGYVYEFYNQSTITLRLPCGFDNSFILEFEGGNPTSIDYEETLTIDANGHDTALGALDDWNKLKLYYGDTDVYAKLRASLVIKRTFTGL